MQQQVKLMQKQAEDARRREEELAHHQNDMLEEFLQRFLVHQGDDITSPTAEQVEPNVKS